MILGCPPALRTSGLPKVTHPSPNQGGKFCHPELLSEPNHYKH